PRTGPVRPMRAKGKHLARDIADPPFLPGFVICDGPLASWSLQGATMKYMRPEDIPRFVQDIVALGCEICAIGYVGYVIGDADLPWEKYEAVSPALKKIGETYGDR